MLVQLGGYEQVETKGLMSETLIYADIRNILFLNTTSSQLIHFSHDYSKTIPISMTLFLPQVC